MPIIQPIPGRSLSLTAHVESVITVDTCDPRTGKVYIAWFWVQGQPKLHSEFKASLDYLTRPFVKNKIKMLKIHVEPMLVSHNGNTAMTVYNLLKFGRSLSRVQRGGLFSFFCWLWKHEVSDRAAFSDQRAKGMKAPEDTNKWKPPIY